VTDRSPGCPFVIPRGLEEIKSFRLTTEQYYMLVDPSNEVLPIATFGSLKVVVGLFA
jgi:type 1 glutamine amidotransferase